MTLGYPLRACYARLAQLQRAQRESALFTCFCAFCSDISTSHIRILYVFLTPPPHRTRIVSAYLFIRRSTSALPRTGRARTCCAMTMTCPSAVSPSSLTSSRRIGTPPARAAVAAVAAPPPLPLLHHLLQLALAGQRAALAQRRAAAVQLLLLQAPLRLGLQLQPALTAAAWTSSTAQTARQRRGAATQTALSTTTAMEAVLARRRRTTLRLAGALMTMMTAALPADASSLAA